MITYTWNILEVSCKPIVQYKKNWIYCVVYECIAKKNELEAKYVSNVSFQEKENIENFIECEIVTKQNVVDWVIESLGNNQLQEIYNNLENDIKEIESPSIVKAPVNF